MNKTKKCGLHQGKNDLMCDADVNVIKKQKKTTMKTRIFLAGIAISIAAFFTSCEDLNENQVNTEKTILPERFKVDIPNSLANTHFKTTHLKSTQDDTLSGNDIYMHLNNFIAIGEGAAEIVEAIILNIVVHHIEDVIYLTYPVMTTKG
ncbi:MAG: hypothetical protein HC906_11905 [Bacteroidales bacterium]|nr:hypothetical protein [Bacteroidales bacterium]